VSTFIIKKANISYYFMDKRYKSNFSKTIFFILIRIDQVWNLRIYTIDSLLLVHSQRGKYFLMDDSQKQIEKFCFLFLVSSLLLQMTYQITRAMWSETKLKIASNYTSQNNLLCFVKHSEWCQDSISDIRIN